MTVPFDALPDHARVWIFPSSRILDPSEEQLLLSSTFSFLDAWTAHDKALTASAKLEGGIFLVVAVDESATGASGCSIDKLHHFVKGAEQTLSVQLMERLNVVFPGNPPVVMHTSKIQGMIANGDLVADSLVYDTTVTELGQFRRKFKSPMQQTWLSRYLQKA